MKTFSIFSIGILLVCAAILVGKVPLFAQVQGPTKAAPKTPPGTAAKEIAKQKVIADQQRRAQDIRFASDVLGRTIEAHAKLTSFQANLRQQTTIGAHSFTSTGRYVQGQDNKLRMELDLKLDSGVRVLKAKLIQVCDGEILKTLRTVGTKHRLTRRNVKQILAAAGNKGGAYQGALRVELGLGGIPALLASMQRTMQFDDYQTKRSGKQTVHVLEGTWNPTYHNHFRGLNQNNPNKKDFPDFVPDRIRVHISVLDTLYILRGVEYLKRGPDGVKYVPLVTLTFEDIKLNPKIDEQAFVFKAPPNIFEEDVTRVYLDQLLAPPPPKKKP